MQVQHYKHTHTQKKKPLHIFHVGRGRMYENSHGLFPYNCNISVSVDVLDVYIFKITHPHESDNSF